MGLFRNHFLDIKDHGGRYGNTLVVDAAKVSCHGADQRLVANTMDRQDVLPTTPIHPSIKHRRSSPHKREYPLDPYKPLSTPPYATLTSGTSFSDGINQTISPEEDSFHDGSFSSAYHDARITISGAGVWNYIEGSEDHSQTEADGQPMTDSPNDVFGLKNTLDTTLPLCDSSYATAGAYNEDITHPNSASLAAEEIGSPNEQGLRYRGYKIPRTQARQEGSSLTDPEAIKYLSLMDDVDQFSIEADETKDVVLGSQRRRRAPQNAIDDPILAFREDCSTIFAINTPHSRTSQSRQWSELPTSSKRMAELHTSDDPITSNGSLLALTGPYAS